MITGERTPIRVVSIRRGLRDPIATVESDRDTSVEMDSVIGTRRFALLRGEQAEVTVRGGVLAEGDRVCLRRLVGMAINDWDEIPWERA